MWLAAKETVEDEWEGRKMFLVFGPGEKGGMPHAP